MLLIKQFWGGTWSSGERPRPYKPLRPGQALNSGRLLLPVCWVPSCPHQPEAAKKAKTRWIPGREAPPGGPVDPLAGGPWGFDGRREGSRGLNKSRVCHRRGRSPPGREPRN